MSTKLTMNLCPLPSLIILCSEILSDYFKPLLHCGYKFEVLTPMGRSMKQYMVQVKEIKTTIGPSSILSSSLNSIARLNYFEIIWVRVPSLMVVTVQWKILSRIIWTVCQDDKVNEVTNPLTPFPLFLNQLDEKQCVPEHTVLVFWIQSSNDTTFFQNRYYNAMLCSRDMRRIVWDLGTIAFL